MSASITSSPSTTTATSSSSAQSIPLANKDLNLVTAGKKHVTAVIGADGIEQQRVAESTQFPPMWETSPTTPRPIIISIEAAIGTGKSTLLRLLQRTIGATGKWMVVQEPVEQWQKIGGQHNLLEAYYKDQDRFAFSFQTNCVLSRIKALQDVLRTCPAGVEVIVLERCWHSDRNTFGQMLHNMNRISELEWALYDDWYRFAVENAPFIDGHVYLEAQTETCMSRLRKRDRTEEVGVTAEYQTKLIECHENWLNALPEQDRVCRVGVDCEFATDDANRERVVSNIQSFIGTLVELRKQRMEGRSPTTPCF